MLLSKLYLFLNKELSIYDFKNIVSGEILIYKKCLDKKGSACTIYLEEDRDGFDCESGYIIYLCFCYLEKKLDAWEINYISEALLLCENIFFTSHRAKEALFYLTDPEYFLLINDKYVNGIVSYLS